MRKLNDKMRIPELLAPAGSMEALKAAIANGADAVYFGGKQFNARQNAANFSEQEIMEAVKLVQAHQVKSYIAFNILLHNDEMEQAAQYFKFLYNAGVDGAIVQDLGLIKLAQKIVPQLELHGSTQMTVHNHDGVQFLAEKGLKRVVLARELSLVDLEDITKASAIELEVFVHGALCICYSGQCLMSSMMGARSGNRGLCAQPCRLPYQLVKGDEYVKTPGNYLISPKDLSTIDILPELLKIGIHSLKFEGRMKRPEYVATVIRIYRKALDRCLQDPDGFRATPEEKRQLAQIFNRDFTSGYYNGKPGVNLISIHRPDNRGLYLGKVDSINHKTGDVKVKLEQPLALEDGLEFVLSKGIKKGITVKEISRKGENIAIANVMETVEIKAPPKTQSGDLIFKTSDENLLTVARSSYEKDFPVVKIPVIMKVTGALGMPLSLTLQDDQGNIVIGETEFIIEKAKNRPLTKETIESQLGRLGTTDFNLVDLKLDIPEEIMVPLSELNNLRRKTISRLENLRNRKNYPQLSDSMFNLLLKDLNTELVPRKKIRTEKPKLAVSIADPFSLEAAINAGADLVYISGEKFRSKNAAFKDYAEVLRRIEHKNIDVYLKLPRIWLDSNIPIMNQMAKWFSNLSIKGFVISNLGTISWVKQHFPGSDIRGDYSLNVLNDLSLKFLQDSGLKGITLSPELTLKEIAQFKRLSEIEIEGLIHGSIPLMISEHCVVGATFGCQDICKNHNAPCKVSHYSLRDRKGFLLPVEMDHFCRMHIFNPQDLCVIDFLPNLLEQGYYSLRIEAVKEGPEYVKGVTEIYREALDELEQDRSFSLTNFKMELAKYSPQGLTKGHYYRGI